VLNRPEGQHVATRGRNPAINDIHSRYKINLELVVKNSFANAASVYTGLSLEIGSEKRGWNGVYLTEGVGVIGFIGPKIKRWSRA